MIPNLYAQVKDYYVNEFSRSTRAKNYLKQRGFDLKFIEKYQIGYSPKFKNRQFLYQLLCQSFKYSPYDLLNSNILSVDYKHGLLIDYFNEDYLIFPCIENGIVKGFSARTLDPSKQPKYKTLKGPESPVLPLFNIDALTAGASIVYLTEGAVDALSLESMGLSALGILGTSGFGYEHLKYFDNYKGDIVIAFDRDPAGQKGAIKLGNLLYEHLNNNIYTLNLPNSDINDFLVLNKNRIKAYSEFSKLKLIPYKPKYDKPAYEKKSFTSNHKYDILRVLEHYNANLKKETMDRYRLSCILPGHLDKTPSMVVYPETNSCFCFGCGASHTPITLIMELEGCNFEKALSIGREICSI